MMLMLPILLQASIHALHAESDVSTSFFRTALVCFNSRSPCGERLEMPEIDWLQEQASIHALHAESDRAGWEPCRKPVLLQFTLSMRRATRGYIGFFRIKVASIHALHAESDEISYLKDS